MRGIFYLHEKESIFVLQHSFISSRMSATFLVVGIPVQVRAHAEV